MTRRKRHMHSISLQARRTLARQRLTPYFYSAPTIALMLGLMLVPLFLVVAYSFIENVFMVDQKTFVGLKHFEDLFSDKVYRTAISNTVVFTVVNVVAHMVLGLIFALMLNTKLLHSKTKAFFRAVYILPWVFTVAVVAILWKLILNPHGILNYVLEGLRLIDRKIEWLSLRETALAAVTVINIWSGYPFYMVSFLAGLQGIPGDIMEAALVDGANPWQRFLHIMLPQLKPIIVSMIMMDCIWTMQQFSMVWMTTGGGPIHKTEMISLYTYKLAFSKFEFSAASASAVVLLAFSILLSIVYVRMQEGRE